MLFSRMSRITPRAARRKAKGSFEPVGFSPIPNIPTRMSILSASASAIELGRVGQISPGPTGL